LPHGGALMRTFLKDFFLDPDGSSSMTRLCMLILSLGAAIGMAMGSDVGAGLSALGTIGVAAVRNKTQKEESGDA
jgi:hypothetical protein